MKKIIAWIGNNALFLSTLFLLAFIPLYPKLPLIDIKNTWVYVRAEDFFVFFVLIIWLVYILKKRITFRTPLTIPILFFWVVGAVATIHGIIIIFPSTANVFPNVAFLSYLRHVEYLSVFFVAFAGMRDKKFLKIVIAVLILTLLGVILYGFGQRYLGLPAYLTMNEEFAKGIPIQLSSLSRVPSTFAGHYDLAAYLVLILPIIGSLIFGFRNWFMKIFLGICVVLGVVLLFMTVSRVSFFVLLISFLIVLFFHKKRFVFYSIPVVAVLAIVFFSFLSTTLLDRFGSTVREINVLVDAKTGAAIGHVQYVPPEYFADKIIGQQNVAGKEQLDIVLGGDIDGDSLATPSALLPQALFSEQTPLVVDINISTGESLPQGTGYINLSLSPLDRKLGSFFYEPKKQEGASVSAEIVIFHGDFLVKRVAAYDLSFTTRFQGGWPNAIEAFTKNIFLGSGYGSVSLAVDNNYLRVLGEIGIIGLMSFVGIFVVLGLYIKKMLPKTNSKILRSFVLGYCAGVIGLALNATLIDVFEASKIAFVLWLLTGVVVGLLSLYQTKESNLFETLKKALLSPYSVIIFIFILTFTIYLPILNNYFIGDDFTWFRWAADCNIGNISQCSSIFERIALYFTSSDGFFYRPGTKVYFLLMYSTFWLNQVVFHAVSIFLHFLVAVLFFFLAKKILKSNAMAIIASALFVIMSGYSEIVLWISATGHLFNAVFILASLLTFILWEEKKKLVFYLFSILFIFLSTLFHEMGVIAPLLIVLYKMTKDYNFSLKWIFKRVDYLILFIPVITYLAMRFFAQSHWYGGDYSYNLLKLPFNFLGNLAGYFALSVMGSVVLPFYQVLRDNLRENIGITLIAVSILILVSYLLYRLFLRRIDRESRRILIFGFCFFAISLLPFLALGNITSRYSYLASLGIIIVIVFFVNKLYLGLRSHGADIAIGSMAVVLAVFSLLHIIQLQQSRTDWKTAGNKIEKFFVSIDSLYQNSWSESNAQLHFVNVPIKHKDAWVFPVGLQDAIWLRFRNDDLQVYIHNDLGSALNVAGVDPNKWVLVFEDDGGVREMIRYKNRITGELEYDLGVE